MPDGIRTRRPRGTTAQFDEAGSPVVAAKVRVPPAAALPRERLLALLGTIWERRLAVVVAPAGSGKTTLLADFAASAGVPVAWYRAETLGCRRAGDPAPPGGRPGLRAAGASARLANRRGGRLRARGAARQPGAARHRRCPRTRRHRCRACTREVRRVRPDLARNRRWIQAATGIQRVANPRRRGAPGDRPGRAPVPRLGGGAVVPRPLPRSGPAGRSRRAGPPDRGLGGGSPALPPGHPRQVCRRAAADPVGCRLGQPAGSRIPHVERDGRPAGGAPRLPRRHVRARPAHRGAVRRIARPPRQHGAARGAVPSPDLHRRAGPGRWLVPLSRGLPLAP